MGNASFLARKCLLWFVLIGINGDAKATKWVKLPNKQGVTRHFTTLRLQPKDLAAIAKRLYGYSQNEIKEIFGSTIVVP
jgi:hypothetical protein